MILRLAAGLAVALAVMLAAAPVAGADPARPGNYRSRVLRIEPSTEVVSAKVVGGDGFMDLHVRPGHKVEIPGYTGEPWLRIDADGSVWENRASSAFYLNETRFGTAGNTQIPAWVSIEGATKHPMWKLVGHGGHFVWHDHRIHYMTPDIPPPLIPGTNRVAIGIRPDGRWVVPITVDGHATDIIGELLVESAPSPLPAWIVVIAVFGALTALGVLVRATSVSITAVIFVVVGALACWAGASELIAVPRLAGGNPIWVALPGVALLAALGALFLRAPALRSILLIAAAGALGVWAVLRVPALGKAVPLGTLDPTLTRMIVAAALGTAAGGIAVAILSGGLALRLEGLDEAGEQDTDVDDADDASGHDN